VWLVHWILCGTRGHVEQEGNGGIDVEYFVIHHISRRIASLQRCRPLSYFWGSIDYRFQSYWVTVTVTIRITNYYPLHLCFCYLIYPMKSLYFSTKVCRSLTTLRADAFIYFICETLLIILYLSMLCYLNIVRKLLFTFSYKNVSSKNAQKIC